MFFLNLATKINFVRVSPPDGVTRGGPPPSPSDATVPDRSLMIA